ncbi:hypothetical protein K8R43_01500 [archaeon]|nr:hypothetical protein [archaeon]
MQYTDEEAKISSALVKESKKLSALCAELNMKEEQVKKALDTLKEKGLVREREGVYFLHGNVRSGILGKEETPDWPFKVHAIIEGQSKDKQVLEKANNVLIINLKKEKMIKACDFVEEDILKEGRLYYVMFECDVYAKHFEDLVYFVIKYGPASIEFEDPGKFTMNRNEAQGILMDISTTLHSYMQTIHQLRQDQEIIIK